MVDVSELKSTARMNQNALVESNCLSPVESTHNGRGYSSNPAHSNEPSLINFSLDFNAIFTT